jgi:RNA polymerase-binding transcription factor DksA
MIAILISALMAQGGAEEPLQRAAERMDEAAKALHEGAGRRSPGSDAREFRIKAVDRALAEQEAALNLVDELLKKMEEEPGCKECGKGG